MPVVYNTSYIDEPTKVSESRHFSMPRISDKPLVCRELKNVTISPIIENIPDDIIGEMILEDGTVVRNTNGNIDYDTISQSTCSQHAVFSGEAIYLGSIPMCWGHYITDGLSKLWFFFTEEGERLLSDHVPVYVTSRFSVMHDIPKAFVSLTNILHIPVDLKIIDEVCHFETVYCPENSIFVENHTRHYTKEYNDTIDRILSSVPKIECPGYQFDKVYMSRTHLPNKHAEFGERDIEYAFRKAGFKIVYPEQLSFAEQLTILRNVKTIATTEGSIAHNFVFCPSSAELVILRKAYYTNDYQYVINDARHLNVTYVDSHLSLFTNNQPNLGPFFLYVNDNLMRCLKDMFNIDIKNSFNRRKYFRYARLCLCKSDFYERTNHEVPEWYYDKLHHELYGSDSSIRKLLKGILKLFPATVTQKIISVIR